MTLPLNALDARITLKGSLGSGGMGEVHRAWDSALERPVAVKFLKGGDSEESDRLILEARLQARVDHAHVVRVLDTGTVGGKPCILLQLVEGRTYGAYAGHGDWRDTVRLAIQAARGLAAAHRQGLIHRDVKPANILVEDTEEGPQARLSDFGLARGEEGGLTRSGILVGTVDYMAPEQVSGDAPVDFRADIYSLGAALYAVLCGHPPFRTTQSPTEGDLLRPSSGGTTPEAPTLPGDLLRRLLQEDPQPLSAEVPGLPRDLSVVVAKAMEKDPSQRYTTAEAMADDLDRVLAGEPIHARTASAFERVLKWSRRNRTSARIALAFGLSLVLALGYMLISARRADQVALDSARMGAHASDMEHELQREFLLPAHDLRPAFQAIRDRIAALEADHSSAEAPKAYALGRGHQLLGNWEAARDHLARARSLGFRTRDGELAYGLVLAELYQSEIKQAKSIPDAKLREERIAHLKQELLFPALALIQSQASAIPERANLLLGKVALLEGRFEEAIRLAKSAQESPGERAEGLFLEAKAYEGMRDAEYVKHAHDAALKALGAEQSALEAAKAIARSDPDISEALVQASLLTASHQRSLGLSMSQALDAARAHLEAAQVLHGNEVRLVILQATLLQRQAMAKKDVGQAGVNEDSAALNLLRQAAVEYPKEEELLRFLANAYYSFCYSKVAVGEDPGSAFQEGYQVVEAAEKIAPKDWRIPYTGALLAQPQSAFLNSRGRDARDAATNGISYAEKAVALGGSVNAKGIRGDCLVELAKAQFVAGEDPRPTIHRIMEANAEGVTLAPTDQIMRINATSAALQSARIIHNLQGDPRPYLEQARQWAEGANPSYIEAQRNRLDLQALRLEVEPGSSRDMLAAAQGLTQDCLEMVKQFKQPLPFQSGNAQRLLAKAKIRAGLDPTSSFEEARKQFRLMVTEDPSAVQAYAELAFTCLDELRWRTQAGRPDGRVRSELEKAITQSRAVGPNQPLVAALEAARLQMESDPRAKRFWSQALAGNGNLKWHPEFSQLH